MCDRRIGIKAQLNDGRQAQRPNKNKGKTFLLQHAQTGVACPVNPGKYGARILREVDGKKSFGEIFDLVRADPQYRFDYPTNDTLFASFKESFEALNCLDRLLLTHRDVLPLADMR
jgi:hypothetical protein